MRSRLAMSVRRSRRRSNCCRGEREDAEDHDRAGDLPAPAQSLGRHREDAGLVAAHGGPSERGERREEGEHRGGDEQVARQEREAADREYDESDAVEDGDRERQHRPSAHPDEARGAPRDGRDQLRQPQDLAEAPGQVLGHVAESGRAVERRGEVRGAVQRIQRVAGDREVARQPQQRRDRRDRGQLQSARANRAAERARASRRRRTARPPDAAARRRRAASVPAIPGAGGAPPAPQPRARARASAGRHSRGCRS